MKLQTQAVSPFHPAILSVFVKNKVEVLMKNENRCTLVLKHGTYIDDINSQIIKLLPKERYYADSFYITFIETA